MDQRQPLIAYSIKPAIAAPLLVSGAASYLAVVDSRWWLLSIPFAILASFGAQPNLNLANGFLAFLSIIIGFAISFYHQRSGLAVCLGSLTAFFLSAAEKRFTAKPIFLDPREDQNASDQH